MISLTQLRMSLQQIASGPTVVVVGLCLAGGNGWQASPAADFLEAEECVVPLPPTVGADPLVVAADRHPQRPAGEGVGNAVQRNHPHGRHGLRPVEFAERREVGHGSVGRGAGDAEIVR